MYGDSAERKPRRLPRLYDISPTLILSADTIVVLAADMNAVEEEGELLEKPSDAADARRMLLALRNRAHQVITAFTLYRSGDPPHVITGHARTAVTMRDYRDAEIAAYITQRRSI